MGQPDGQTDGHAADAETLATPSSSCNKLSPWGGETICPPPADGSSTRGGSTSFRGRVRSPHVAKLQAASVPIA